MATCNDCIHDGACGKVMEEHAELCEVFVDKNMKMVYGKAPESDIVPGDTGLREKEIETTTLKVKAAGYDVIKEIVDEQHKIGFSHESAMDIISGAILMEEAVMKALI